MVAHHQRRVAPQLHLEERAELLGPLLHLPVQSRQPDLQRIAQHYVENAELFRKGLKKIA